MPSKHKEASWFVFGLRKSQWESNTRSSSWELLDASHCAVMAIVHRHALIHWKCSGREALTWHRYLWEFWVLIPITWNGAVSTWIDLGLNLDSSKGQLCFSEKWVFYLLKKKMWVAMAVLKYHDKDSIRRCLWTPSPNSQRSSILVHGVPWRHHGEELGRWLKVQVLGPLWSTTSVQDDGQRFRPC